MQNDKIVGGAQTQADELEDRLIDFAVRIVKLSASLPQDTSGQTHCGTDHAVWHFSGAKLR